MVIIAFLSDLKVCQAKIMSAAVEDSEMKGGHAPAGWKTAWNLRKTNYCKPSMLALCVTQ